MNTTPRADPTDLTSIIRQRAIALGFDAVGIAPVTDSEHATLYESWLAQGHHGTMSYLAREDAVRARTQPQAAWPGVRSAVVVALHYDATEPARAAGEGIIARYARGRDYHKVIKPRLLRLLEHIEAQVGRDIPIARAYVDTGPVFERELARRAGMGWFGRSTMLLHPRRGSYFFLGTLLLDIELAYDEPFTADHCGTCTACVSSCPTGALLDRDENNAPVMNATRCISYLTIENRGPIPRELRSPMGNRIFGCDICQEVCPWNGQKFVQITREPDFAPRPHVQSPDLIALMSMTYAEWDSFTRGSPIRRAGYDGLRRNVAVALGNSGSAAAVPALGAAIADSSPLVRAHAAWALGRIGTAAARSALHKRRATESDMTVRDELDAALLQEPYEC